VSSIIHPEPDPLGSPDTDPYYYGFRDEPVLQPDGTYQIERVALTLEDHLHPHEGDCFMEGSLHDLVRSYLRDVFRMQVQDDPKALVLSDTGIYWDDPDLRHHCPDVAVIFGIRQQRVQWRSFMVADEGVRPSLHVEVVTPRYRDNDVVKKMKQYHKARVPTYVILDREREDSPWVLRAYQRGPRRYVPIPLDERGRLWLPAVDLWLAVQGQQVLCYEDENEEPLGDYTVVAKRLAQTQKLAEAAKVRADAADVRAEAEKLRADAADVRTGAAEARAEAAEARLRELLAENERLKGLSS
jgi:Uma2 family endonuclease